MMNLVNVFTCSVNMAVRFGKNVCSERVRSVTALCASVGAAASGVSIINTYIRMFPRASVS